MADFTRVVEIVVRVTGDTGAQVSRVADNLQKIDDIVVNLGTHIEKTAGLLSGLTTSLKSISSVTVPPLKDFAADIKKLADVDSAKLAGTTKALNDLSTVKINTSIGKLFEQLTGISGIGDPAKVTALADALARFGAVSKLPSLTTFVNNLQTLSGIDKLPSLQGLANQLTTISQISKLPPIGAFVNSLAALTGVSAVPNLAGLTKSLSDLSSIKGTFPDLKGVTAGIAGISAISKPESFAALITSLGKLTTIDSKKFPDPKILKDLGTSISAFSQIGQIPSIAKFVTAIQGIQSIGKITIPSFAGIIAEVDRLTAAFTKLANVAPFITALNQMGNTAAQLQQQLNNLNIGVNNSKSTFDKFFSKIQTYVGYRIVADSVMYLKEAITAAQDTIIDFDQGLKDLQAITGATDIEVAMMGDTIKKVAESTKFSAAEVANGMTILGQAGLSATESSRAMLAVANLATGTLSDMSQSVDLISTSMNVFSIEASRASDVADVLANAVNKSKLDIEKLRTAINYVGPVAEEAGLGLQEMAASMMTLSNSGLRASTIGTSLRSILNELIQPSAKFQKAIQNAGLAVSELDPRVNDFKDVVQKLGVVLQDQQVAIEVFGKRASAGVLTLVRDSKNGYGAMLAATKQTGTAAAMAEIQMEGLGVSFKNVRDKAGVLAIELGEGGITQSLRLIASISKTVLDALIQLAQNGFVKIVSQAALMTASVFTVYTTLGLLKNIPAILTKVAASLGIVSTAATGAAASMSLLSKIGIWTALFGAIVIALDLFKNKSEEASLESSKMVTATSDAIAGLDSYAKKQREASGDIVQTTENNKALRVELMEVAKNGAKFGEPMANAALKAMSSINALTGSIKDQGVAIAAYRKEVEKIRTLELANHFREAMAALNEGYSGKLDKDIWTADWWARQRDIVKNGFSKIAEEFRKSRAQIMITNSSTADSYNPYAKDAPVPESVASAATTDTDTESKSERIAQETIKGLLSSKIAWKDYVTYIETLMSKVELTPSEEEAKRKFGKINVLVSEAMTELSNKGMDVTTESIDGMMKKISDSITNGGFGIKEGTILFDALKSKLEETKTAFDNLANESSKNWNKSGTDIKQTLADLQAQMDKVTNPTADGLKDVIKNAISSLDTSGLQEVYDKRARIIKEEEELDKQFSEAKKQRDAERTALEIANANGVYTSYAEYAKNKEAIDKEYFDKSGKLVVAQADLHKRKLKEISEEANNPNVFNTEKLIDSIKKYLEEMATILSSGIEMNSVEVLNRLQALADRIAGNISSTMTTMASENLKKIVAEAKKADDEAALEMKRIKLKAAVSEGAALDSGESPVRADQSSKYEEIDLLDKQINSTYDTVMKLDKALTELEKQNPNISPEDATWKEFQTEKSKYYELMTRKQELLNSVKVESIQISKQEQAEALKAQKAAEERANLELTQELESKRAIMDKKVALLEEEKINAQSFTSQMARDKATMEINSQISAIKIAEKKEELDLINKIKDAQQHIVDNPPEGSSTEQQKDSESVLAKLTEQSMALSKQKFALEQNGRITARADEKRLAASTLSEIETAWSHGEKSVEDYRDAVQNALNQGVLTSREASRRMIAVSDDMGAAFRYGLQESLASMKTDAEFMMELGGQITDRLSDGFYTAFESIANGSKSAAKAFDDMAKDIIMWLSQMIIKQMVFNAVAKTMGTLFGVNSAASPGTPVGSYTPGGGMNIFGEAKAEGGLISGISPHPTADDKLAWVTSGEFFHPVKAVEHYGVAFMESIRNMRFPKSVAKLLSGFSMSNVAVPSMHFATGGLVAGNSISSISGALGGGNSRSSAPVAAPMAMTHRLEVSDNILRARFVDVLDAHLATILASR